MDARVIDEKLCRQVVAGFDDIIASFEKRCNRCLVEESIEHGNGNVFIRLVHFFLDNLRLPSPHVVRSEQELARQVSDVDAVAIRNLQRANACRRKYLYRGISEPTTACDSNRRVFKLDLPFAANFL